MSAVSKSDTRVIEHTSEEINRKINQELEARVYYFADRLDRIENRLYQLEKEWDIERVLEANAAGISLLGLMLGARNHKWFLLPAVVASFLLQHAIQGWCPPLAVFRRLGVRTTKEINRERYALKALRGDFDKASSKSSKSSSSKAADALEAAEF